VQVALDVNSKKREERRLEESILRELGAANTAAAAEKREEAAIKGFQQAIQTHQQVCRFARLWCGSCLLSVCDASPCGRGVQLGTAARCCG